MKLIRLQLLALRMKLTGFILLPLLWVTPSLVKSQDAIQYSQYFSNQLVINPAYAGADDALSITLVHRNQWTGIQGAPSTTTITGHTLFKQEKTGLGMSLFVDEINIHRNVNFAGIYSYRIKTGKNSYLSMGLQAGLNHVRSDYASLTTTIYNPMDPGLPAEQQSKTEFQFGTGVFFKGEKLEFGLSAPVLYTSGEYGFYDTLTHLNSASHYFLHARYKFRVNQNVMLVPGFLIKSQTGRPIAVDYNFETILKEVVMVAVSYRSFESMSLILQMKLLPQLRFGYSYDIPLKSQVRQYFNAHELMLNYVFKYNNYKVRSPR